ncbi:MAG: hypothetical protein HQL59_03340 [Magnetococcales bacterium]|nr:hypothetical protein [Magnetococcales bacterium]
MNEELHALAGEIRAELHREVDNLREELLQVRKLVQDAILKLTESFSGIRDQANSQHVLVTSLTSSMDAGDAVDPDGVDAEAPPPAPAEAHPHGGTGSGESQGKRINIRQFVAETDGILRTFVDHIILVSRQSMEMVHRVDDLSAQMQEVVALLKDVNAIAEQTNVLALNARIVAARAGQAGAPFSVVAGEVRKLAKSSNQFSDKIRGVVTKSQQDIEAAKGIIEIMASKDMSFAIESKGRVDDMMAEVSEIDRFTAITLTEVSRITDALNHSVGVAVMSLQFEDMVTQLTGSIENKLAIVESVMDGLSEPPSIEPTEIIPHLRLHLEAQKERFDEVDRRAVRQTSMDEGDIELF